MLSIVDIKKELGDNIFIYPLRIESIKSNSIDLRVSEFAWSISTKKSLFDGDNKIVIPPRDTALVYSQEAIYVSNKIGGTYHSKVRLVSKGIGHIGTTLDAQYCGLSVVALHNVTDQYIILPVGSEFVTISFYYLHRADYPDTVSHDNPPGHISIISSYSNYEQFQQWEDSNRWCRNKTELIMCMIQSEEYKHCKEQFKKEQIVFNRQYWKRRIPKYTIIIALWIAVNILLSVPSYFVNLGNVSKISIVFMEKISLPLALSIIVPNLIIDVKND